MNIYTALHGHADSPIGKFAWGSMVLTSVNLQLPEEKKFKFESPCKEVLDGILNMPNELRQEFLKMDVPSEDIEEVRQSYRSKIVVWTCAALLVASIVITAMYVTNTGTGGPDQGVLDSLFNFMGQVLKIMSPGTAPDTGS